MKRKRKHETTLIVLILIAVLITFIGHLVEVLYWSTHWSIHSLK